MPRSEWLLVGLVIALLAALVATHSDRRVYTLGGSIAVERR